MADPLNPYAPPGAELERSLTGASMLEGELDIGRLLEATWAMLQAKPAEILIAGFAYLAPIFLASVISQVVQTPAQIAFQGGEISGWAYGALVAVATICTQIVQLYFTLGLMRWCLELVRGQAPSAAVVFSGYRWFLSGAVAWFLWIGGYILGLVFFIVPGIIWGLGTGLNQMAIVDRDMGPIDALAESWTLTKGYKATLFGWLFASGFALGIVGCFTCGFGLLLTPMIWIGVAYVYEHARARHALS